MRTSSAAYINKCYLRYINILFFFALMFVSQFAMADELNDRSVLLEWDAVASAQTYEVEVTGAQGLRKTFETKEISYRLNLPPGIYQFRVRAKDRRNLQGPWSQNNQIEVKVALVRYLEPALNWESLAQSDSAVPIHFAWTPAAGAKEYLFILEDENKKR